MTKYFLLFIDVLQENYCRFTSSWLSDEDDVMDEDGLGLVDLAAEANIDIRNKILIVIACISLIVFISTIFFCFKKGSKSKNDYQRLSF